MVDKDIGRAFHGKLHSVHGVHFGTVAGIICDKENLLVPASDHRERFDIAITETTVGAVRQGQGKYWPADN